MNIKEIFITDQEDAEEEANAEKSDEEESYDDSKANDGNGKAKEENK